MILSKQSWCASHSCSSFVPGDPPSSKQTVRKALLLSLENPGGSVTESARPWRRQKVPSLGQEDPLGKEMANHSSFLAWRIPWTEEPGRLHGVTKSDTTEWLSRHAHLTNKEARAGTDLSGGLLSGAARADGQVCSRCASEVLKDSAVDLENKEAKPKSSQGRVSNRAINVPHFMSVEFLLRLR